MTSRNIMKTGQYSDSIMYKASCSCSCKDHDLYIFVEKDKELNSINLEFDANIYFIDESLIGKKGKDLYITILKNIWLRIKKSFRLLFTGYLEMETTFIIDKEDQMKDFINALIEGIEHLKVK